MSFSTIDFGLTFTLSPIVTLSPIAVISVSVPSITAPFPTFTFSEMIE